MRHVIIDTETDIVDLQGGKKVREVINTPNLVLFSYCQYDGDLADPGQMSITTQSGVHSLRWNNPNLRKKLETWLSDPNCLLYGHNFAFDLRVILKQFPQLGGAVFDAIVAGRIFDTKVLARLREPCAKDYSLDALSFRYFDQRIEGKSDIRLSFTRKVPLSKAQIKYAQDDIYTTCKLVRWLERNPQGSVYNQRAPFQFQRKRIVCASKGSLGQAIGPWHPLDVLYSQANLMCKMYTETIPWGLDKELLAKFSAEANEITEKHAKGLYDAGLMRRDRDTKAPVEDLGSPEDYERLRWPMPPRKWTLWEGDLSFVRTWKGRGQGQPGRWVLDGKRMRAFLRGVAIKHGLGDVPTSTTTQDLSLTYDYWKQHEELLADEGAKDFLPYARQQKYVSSFYGPLGSVRGEKMHPNYWIPGAETLRWAASKPCIHQVPKKLRPLYRAPEGFVVVGADYSALELYTLAHLMSCMGIEGPMLATLKSGVDPHSFAASLLLGGDWTDYEKGGPNDEKRQSAKALNFGVPGGMGARTVHKLGRQAYGLKWSFSEAKGLFHHYKDTFSDVGQYLETFQVDPYSFKNAHETKSEFLARCGFPEGGRWPSRWDLRGVLDFGRFVDVQLPTGAVIPARNYTQGANCGFQSLGAQVCTRAYVDLVAAGFKVIAQIHDALYVLSPARDAENNGSWLCSIMRRALKEVCTKAPPQTLEYEIKETLF
jgi:hypothetical protein